MGEFQSVINELTSTQLKYLCEKFDMEKDEILSASEETLDEIYDALCDLECELIPSDNSELSDECKIVGDIITLMGNTLAIPDEDDFDEE